MGANQLLLTVLGIVTRCASSAAAASPVRKRTFSKSVVTKITTSDGFVDFTPAGAIELSVKQADSAPDLVSPVRKHTFSGSVTADGVIKVSGGLVASNPDAASPVRKRTFSKIFAGRGVLESSNGFVVSTTEASPIVVRSVKKRRHLEIDAGGDIQIYADSVDEEAATKEPVALFTASNASMRQVEIEGKAIKHHGGKSLGFESKRLSNNIRPFASLSESQTHAMTTELTSFTSFATNILKGWKLFTISGEALAHKISGASQTRSTRPLQTIKGLTFSHKRDLLFLCALPMLIVPVVFISFYMCSGVDKAELYSAAQHALMFKESEDWRHSLLKLRELRQDKFNKNHPLYSTVEAHMALPRIQVQLQSLFMELKEGEDFLTSERLNFMLTNLHLEITIPPLREVNISPTSTEYAWLVNSIERPLTCSTFVSIFAVLLVVLVQAYYMSNADTEMIAQGQSEEELDEVKIEYCVEIRGRVACRASFHHSRFQAPLEKSQGGVAEDRQWKRSTSS